MTLFYQQDISSGQLDEEESRHAAVLRLKPGDPLQLTDGEGNLYRALVSSLNKSSVNFKVIDTVMPPRRKYFIHLAIAPTKNINRMEWMVEKCVETGIDQISFIQCQASDRKEMGLHRLRKVAISAMKQSGQVLLPRLSPLVSFRDFLGSVNEGQRFIAHVDPANPTHLKHALRPGDRTTVLIGPEGDFTSEEISLANESGWTKVGLGPTRLRTETAGLVAVEIIHFVNV